MVLCVGVKSSKPAEICLVYLGASLPRYVIENLKYLRETFNENEIVLISDNVSSLRRANRLGVKTYQVPNKNDLWPQVIENLSFSINFRDAFWLYTLSRFKAIQIYMHQNSQVPVLHVESDVWISENFPIADLVKAKDRIAYPFTNSTNGLASSIYFPHEESISALISFAESQIMQGVKLNDVELLGSYRRDFPNQVYVLPSCFPDENLARSGSTSTDKEIVSSNYEDFHGVFDGSTWGVYLIGTDPRNTYGISRHLSKLQGHTVDPSMATFMFSANRLFAKGNNSNIIFEIFSLHIHCKAAKMFSAEGLERYFRKNKRPIDARMEYITFSFNGFILFIWDRFKLARAKLAKVFYRG